MSKVHDPIVTDSVASNSVPQRTDSPALFVGPRSHALFIVIFF